MLKQFLKDHGGRAVVYKLREMSRWPHNCKLNMRYRKAVKRCNKKPGTDKIRLVFIVQFPTFWGKIEPVYRRASEREDYEVLILTVPVIDRLGEVDHLPADTENAAYESLKNENTVVLNALDKDGNWIDLEKYQPDYVFYPRPYDIHLPKLYQSGSVKEYAKVCYVTYGFLISKVNQKTCMNKEFFRNCYFYFAENAIVAKINRRRMPLSHMLGYRKTVNIGYPSLLHIMEQKDVQSPLWDFARGKDLFRIIWTPRWTTNLQAGGSNFFRYKEKVFEYAQKNQEAAVLYRPHPLTFQNFLHTGEWTQEEMDEFLHRYEIQPNMNIDQEKEYGCTFWESDVLLTDGSSIDVDYFITGKPIIRCMREEKIKGEFNAFKKEMLKGIYCAYSWEEVENYLTRLQKGEDPLKEIREQLVQTLFSNNFDTMPDDFLNEIKRDRITVANRKKKANRTEE